MHAWVVRREKGERDTQCPQRKERRLADHGRLHSQRVQTQEKDTKINGRDRPPGQLLNLLPHHRIEIPHPLNPPTHMGRGKKLPEVLSSKRVNIFMSHHQHIFSLPLGGRPGGGLFYLYFPLSSDGSIS